MSRSVPLLRIEACNDAPVRGDGAYVLYWMIATRRASYNFALDRALECARELGKPLVVFEALRSGYPWASDRLHRFVIEGMVDNAREFEAAGITYYPYVEGAHGEGRGLLEALAERAALVITDEFPCFFLPRMVAAAARKLAVRLEQVDSNGLLPLRATELVFPTAYAFRRFLQRTLPPHLAERPRARPLAQSKFERASLPKKIVARWPHAKLPELLAPSGLASLPIDHGVQSTPLRGGAVIAQEKLRQFVRTRLARYNDDRNQPSRQGTSQLSPYLHFGHLSPHEIFETLARQEGWTDARRAKTASGQREGYWGMGADAEAFVDQFVTWRELGYNMCHKRADYSEFDSLPNWAKTTLQEHERDARPHLFTIEQLSRGETYDDVWNAAQLELVRDGWMHNYMRMLWGKKILEWSETPRAALSTMIELMNKYSLDGRNPNSYTGYFWTLGRYDRPWGPERPIFGKVRYMSSDNTRRKLDLVGYLEEHAPSASGRRKKPAQQTLDLGPSKK